VFQVEAEVNEKVKEGGKWSQRKIEWMEAENDNSARSLECRKELLARTRSAHLPTAMLFFAVTSVTLGMKREGKKNVFVKTNEQNRACSSYAMARKRRMKSNEKSGKNDGMKSPFFVIVSS